MKKRIPVLTMLTVLTLGLLVAGCGGQKKQETQETVVRIGLMGEELRPAWTRAAEFLAAEGIKVDLVNFSDYAVPNRALADGDIELNSFQHDAFLQNEIANNGYQISSFGNTVIFFLGVYSNKIKTLEELKDGDTIVIMNDATNGGRALKVLESAGVFTLDPSKGNVPTVNDITVNPKNIKIVEVDAAQTYRTLDDPQVAAAVVNSNFVVDAGGVPLRDAIYIKPIDSESDKPYINIVVGRDADRDNETYKKVVAAFQTEEVKKVIEEEPPLTGIALPAW
ncbi:MAG: MetQ/NlpA family ABC transporter substrate-binding protein [Spirochaetaceae bacterium]|jgi:D-methionine transport system substrate-binding protein|nr:MetQ/NlpA family ABC transporter substrate-binding protein [Spirochaetaceae bacterium]